MFPRVKGKKKKNKFTIIKKKNKKPRDQCMDSS